MTNLEIAPAVANIDCLERILKIKRHMGYVNIVSFYTRELKYA